jgi:hypothetical protein
MKSRRAGVVTNLLPVASCLITGIQIVRSEMARRMVASALEALVPAPGKPFNLSAQDWRQNRATLVIALSPQCDRIQHRRLTGRPVAFQTPAPARLHRHLRDLLRFLRVPIGGENRSVARVINPD